MQSQEIFNSPYYLCIPSSTISSRLHYRNSYRSRNSLELLPSTASQVLTERAAADLTPIFRHGASSNCLFCDFVASFLDRSYQLRLQSGRMNAIGVKTFVDELGAGHEVGEGIVRSENMS
jgi:prepilin-type processing-associated H-X9-DG protein